MNPKLTALVVLLVAMSPLALFVGTARADDRHGRSDFDIRALSSRPDTVSGGDVLVRVALPRGLHGKDVRVTLNGRDVTGVFRREAGGRSVLGLVQGLRLGSNTLRARGGGHDSALRLINHPVTGPIFSGPQEQPFFCQTHEFRVYPNGPFLTATQIVDPCYVATRVDYVYRTTRGPSSRSIRPRPRRPTSP